MASDYPFGIFKFFLSRSTPSDTLISIINKTDRHDIVEIMLQTHITLTRETC
jgi:hypothetical protein